MPTMRFIFISLGQIIWTLILWCVVMITVILSIPMFFVCVAFGLKGDYLALQKKLGEAIKIYIGNLAKRN